MDAAHKQKIIASNIARTRHGHTRGKSKSPTFRSWQQMIRRCSDDRHKQYANYGGRGIRVCERWSQSFEAFLADAGERPSVSHSLDRINTNGHYEPGNVRWATPAEQSRNQRRNHVVTIDGVTRCLRDWIAECPVNHATVFNRLAAGWSVEDALFMPPSNRGNRGARK